MNNAGVGAFARGLAAGLAVAGLTAGALVFLFAEAPDWLASAAIWTGRNLGLAAGAFAAVLVAWMRSLGCLRDALAAGGPPERVMHYDSLADVWVGLFFGVGVIWTAIGMRAALLEALQPGAAVGDGAQMLARLVDGGILLSLSTTIVGAIGGYLMRVTRSLWLGPRLRRYYRLEETRDIAALRASVSAIEHRLEALATAPPPPDWRSGSRESS